MELSVGLLEPLGLSGLRLRDFRALSSFLLRGVSFSLLNIGDGDRLSFAGVGDGGKDSTLEFGIEVGLIFGLSLELSVGLPESFGLSGLG